MDKIIIDVREPAEYASGHVEGAVNIPPMEILANSPKLDNIPKDAEIILYCISGSRSNVAINILRSRGYTNLINGINKDHVAAKHLS